MSARPGAVNGVGGARAGPAFHAVPGMSQLRAPRASAAIVSRSSVLRLQLSPWIKFQAGLHREHWGYLFISLWLCRASGGCEQVRRWGLRGPPAFLFAFFIIIFLNRLEIVSLIS